MSKNIDTMINEIMQLAKEDKEYCRRLGMLKSAEDTLYELESDMTLEQRDAVWELWGACSNVDRRLLEIACKQMLEMEEHL